MVARNRQWWITEASNIIQNNKAFSRAVMRSPQLQKLLGNYLTQLQRAVNRGQFTPRQALDIFKTGTKNIHQALQRQLQKATTPLPPDPNDLTQPLNMVNALNNPNTYVSQMAADTVGMISASFNEIAAEVETATNTTLTTEEKAEEQSAEDIQQESIEEAQNQAEEQGHLGKDLRAACEVVTVGILEMNGRGLADAENIAENIFKEVGEALGMDTSNMGAGEEAIEEIAEKVSSPFDMKLEPPKE